MDQRLKEAAKLGFSRAVLPQAFAPGRELQRLELTPMSQLDELVAWFGLPRDRRSEA
jgi:predicted ATP-dependent serine protease